MVASFREVTLALKSRPKPRRAKFDSQNTDAKLHDQNFTDKKGLQTSAASSDSRKMAVDVPRQILMLERLPRTSIPQFRPSKNRRGPPQANSGALKAIADVRERILRLKKRPRTIAEHIRAPKGGSFRQKEFGRGRSATEFSNDSCT